MTQTQYQLAKSALSGISVDLHLGMAVTRTGSRIVRVNVPADAPDSVVDLVHQRLSSIPHEIRRVRAAQLEWAPR